MFNKGMALFRLDFNKTNTIFNLLVLLFCSIALYFGIQATGDLTWGIDSFDLNRDLSNAQAIKNGKYPGDSVYKGETHWYNPLVPSIIAILSGLLGQPVNIIHVRAGAYLNLLVPISFYVMSNILFRDRKVAIAATAGYIFLGTAPATYSPWLIPSIFSQALFYFTLSALVSSIRTGRWRWFVLTGIL